MKDKEIDQFVQKGFIHIRSIFEMAGNPKEHVEATLKQYVSKIKEDPDYIFLKEYFAPAEENEGIWSTFHESEILVNGLDKLNILCFNLSPANIEIVRPEIYSMTDKQLTHHYNDILSKLHESAVVIKNATSENDLLKLNLNRAIRNCVVLALSEQRNADELALKVGIDKEHLQPFLDAMIREKSIILEDSKYKVNK